MIRTHDFSMVQIIGHSKQVWKFEEKLFFKSWQPESCCNRLAPPASVLSAFLVSDWVYIFIFVSPWTIPLWPSGKVIWTTWQPRDRQIEPPEGQIFKFSNFKSWNEKKKPNQNLNHRMPRELINGSNGPRISSDIETMPCTLRHTQHNINHALYP